MSSRFRASKTQAHSGIDGAAIEKKIAGPDNGSLYTEDDWNNEATIDKYPYHLSKVAFTTSRVFLPLTGFAVFRYSSLIPASEILRRGFSYLKTLRTLISAFCCFVYRLLFEPFLRKNSGHITPAGKMSCHGRCLKMLLNIRCDKQPSLYL